jgi:hypothetical protein
MRKQQAAVPRGQPIEHLGQKAARRLVDLVDPAKVDDDVLGLLGKFVDAPDQAIGGAEEKPPPGPR